MQQAAAGLFLDTSLPLLGRYEDLSRFYAASDGILLISVYERDLPKFAHVEGLEGLEEVPCGAHAAFLAPRFLTMRALDWVERLQAADIAAAVCENLETLRAYNARTADEGTGIDRGSYYLLHLRRPPQLSRDHSA